MSKTRPITVKFPSALADELQAEAVRSHRSLSELLRIYAERELRTDRADPIREAVRQEVQAAVKQQANRMAALLHRSATAAGAAYYASISLVSALVDSDHYTSFQKIERLARRKGLDFANLKKPEGLAEFMDDGAFDEAVRQIKGPKPKRQEPGELTYEELRELDYSSMTFDDDDEW